jgi:NAD(P)-dependent dehydrogenase (short-subunit alcohol dehydrogenase family)
MWLLKLVLYSAIAMAITRKDIARGLFCAEMNASFLEGTDRGREFLARSPIDRFSRELMAAAVFIHSDAGSFVSGHILTVDGGFLAGGVNQ